MFLKIDADTDSAIDVVLVLGVLVEPMLVL